MKTDTPSARSSRRSAGVHSIANVILLFILLLMVNYLATKYYKHVDLSTTQFYTLSGKTIEQLAKLDSPINIYTYIDPKNDILSKQVATLLKEYEMYGGKNVIVEKINPAYNEARANELQKELHLLPSDYCVIFQKKDRPLRFVRPNDIYDFNRLSGEPTDFKGEQAFTGAITALVEGKSSKVYFLQGHGEHSPNDLRTGPGYGFLGEGLKAENIDFDLLNLSEKGDVPDDAGAVVMAGPATALFPIEVEALNKYLSLNGKLLILLDPYCSSGFEKSLAQYGLQLDDDEVFWRGSYSIGVLTRAMAVIGPPGGFSSHPITENFALSQYGMQIDDVRSITLLAGDNGQPNPRTMYLLRTIPSQWGRLNNSPPASDPTTMTFDKAHDIAGPLIVSAEYDGGTVTDPKTKATETSTRIIAVGASKFLDNEHIGQNSGLGGDFFLNCLNWLVKKSPVLDISPKKPAEYGLSLSPISLRTTYWFAVLFVPGIALALGIFTWLSRRK